MGAGGLAPEDEACGYPHLSGPERLGQLLEAVQILPALRTQDEATVDGHYCRASRAINEPKALPQPCIRLLIAGAGEKVHWLVAQYPDLHDGPGSLETLTRKREALCDTVPR